MHSLTTRKQNLSVQKGVALLSIGLLVIKLFAYVITHSVAILTDALESIVNVVASFIGLYSLIVAARPRDKDHPYGHGKAEFLSAAIEGTMVLSAGAVIIFSAVKSLFVPVMLHRLDTGIYLVALAGLLNFLFGLYSLRLGKRTDSAVLISSGRHLMSDSYTTGGIILGLLVVRFTGLQWMDGVIAILFGLIVGVMGYVIVRQSIAGIMDEADEGLLGKIVNLLNSERRENWIDLHNLRIIKYGSVLHLDCHLTVPWYLNVHEAHAEIDALGFMIRKEFGESVELFVHCDGCQPFSCRICSKANCSARQYQFERSIEWTLDNILQDQKHKI